ncbi:MAG: FIG00460418: hypothetical protein [uncultured Paraburkholderia sp.]|nr:MAG: FIG00460418: hypothetical protein [uncultured Paraburkholderia sp.]CAH2939645.1 MAG: FIG00460418: hypothetical protein [uncultured Paraburkholderia sp.]
MPLHSHKRTIAARCRSAVLTAMLATLSACLIAALGACASTPAEPVPFKAVPAARIVQPGYTKPGTGLVAVDVRRERSRDVIVRFHDALVYVDGEQVTDLMNGEHVVFYLSLGVHRIGVSMQFDPVVELRFTVTADPRYTNRASITFSDDHRIALHRVAQ